MSDLKEEMAKMLKSPAKGSKLTEEQRKGLARLREPFPASLIDKLPPHGLSYVGHAALTDRFLEVDPEWDWAPVAWDEATGGPRLDKDGGMWIWLTICGVTRLGYGDPGRSTKTNGWKERIGDALRNGGMRFGVALDLWCKSSLHELQESRGVAPSGQGKAPETKAAKPATKKGTETPPKSAPKAEAPPVQDSLVKQTEPPKPAPPLPRDPPPVPTCADDVVAVNGSQKGQKLVDWPTDYLLKSIRILETRQKHQNGLEVHLAKTLELAKIEAGRRIEADADKMKAEQDAAAGLNG